MEEIKCHDGRVIAYVVKKDFNKKGVNFISKQSYPLQFGVSNYTKDHRIIAHYHLQREVKIKDFQEVVHVDKGKARVDLYRPDGIILKSVELSEGDTIFFVDGGHGFQMLEDTRIIEVKQGPYSGKENDKRMIE